MVISGKFQAKKNYYQLFFPQKKNSVRHPKMIVFRFWDRTWDPFRKSKIFFSQHFTYSYSLLGWNLPGITMALDSLHNYFGITVKSRKNDGKFGFFYFCLWFWNNDGIIATLRKSPVNFTPKNNIVNFFSTKKKKNYVRHPKMVVYRVWDRTCDPLRESKIFFSQNLTYSYSFLGWNLPGITMSLESLHNYFVIRVKSRKNDEKIGFFEFWLWCRDNDEMIGTSR